MNGDLPRYTVKNFTGSDTLRCQADYYASATGEPGSGDRLVHLIQYAGSMSMQFSLVPEAARELADALHACANALAVEVLAVEVEVEVPEVAQ